MKLSPKRVRWWMFAATLAAPTAVLGQVSFDTLGAWVVQVDQGDTTSAVPAGAVRIPDFYSGVVRKEVVLSGIGAAMLWLECENPGRRVGRIAVMGPPGLFETGNHPMSVTHWFGSEARPVGPLEWARESSGRGPILRSGRHPVHEQADLETFLAGVFDHESVTVSIEASALAEPIVFRFQLAGFEEAWLRAGCTMGYQGR